MSRRLSIQLKNSTDSKPKPRVKFTDELVFLESIKDNDIQTVRSMLRRASVNIDLNKINDTGLTALHQAVLENSLDLVTILLESSANVNTIDEDSWTPLHAAASMGYYEIAKFLLENGADSNALTVDNERPIDLVDQNNFPLISLLLNNMNLNQTENEDSLSLIEENIDGSMTKNTMSTSNNNNDNSDVYHRLFLSIFRSKNDNDSILNDIEKLFENDKKYFHSNKFIKLLSGCICESSLIKNELNKNDLKNRLPILARFSEQYLDFELECLTAVNELTERLDLSSDCFKKIVTCFNEAKLISNSTYQIWKNRELNLDKKKIALSFKN